jgi:NADPH:quinone reductase-like Zn-dependent oxidoreductase
MKVYEYPKLGLENLTLADRVDLAPAAHEVTVKIHAVSLNYRDLLFAWGLYNPHPHLPAIPCSDAAGEITSVGESVTRWKVGDRVCPIFMQGWLEGEVTPAKAATALGGGQLDGVLREYGNFHEEALVPIPDHLSFEEASTLPCAAVTAWSALVTVGRIKAGETVLVLGTGGVSIFALQLACLHGGRVICTSSSDEKLARARELGAQETINYKTTPDWDKELMRLTDGVGVDHIVEVGGAGTLARSSASARMGGNIAVIGVLAKGDGFNPIQVVMKSLHLNGIYVGSRQTFQELNRAVTGSGLKPVIDRTFPFDQAREALAYMESGSHFGKIVIRVG